MGQYHPFIQETFIGQLVWGAVAEIYLTLDWHECRYKYSTILHKRTQYIYIHVSIYLYIYTVYLPKLRGTWQVLHNCSRLYYIY